MVKIERSVTINAPADRVFSYLSGPMNLLEWVPSLTDVRDVTGYGMGQKFSWTYEMIGMSFKGESEITEHVINQRIVKKSSGGISSTWTWTLEPVAGGTRLNLVVEYTIPVPVLGKVAERLVLRQNEREADFAIVNLKEMVEWWTQVLTLKVTLKREMLGSREYRDKIMTLSR